MRSWSPAVATASLVLTAVTLVRDMSSPLDPLETTELLLRWTAVLALPLATTVLAGRELRQGMRWYPLIAVSVVLIIVAVTVVLNPFRDAFLTGQFQGFVDF